MKRAAYVAVILAVLLAVTSAVAYHLWEPHRPQYEASGTGGNGFSWHLTGDFAGAIRIFDANHNPIVYTGATGDGSGQVTLQAQGETFTLSGVGEHPLQDKNGRVLGYVVMRATSQ